MKYQVTAKKGHETIVFTLVEDKIEDALEGAREHGCRIFGVHKGSMIELKVEEIRD